MAIVPGFVTDAAVDAMVAESDPLADGGNHQDIDATPYLELPDEGWPDDHPRHRPPAAARSPRCPYDDFAPDSELRALYEWDALMDFVALALGKERLYRYDDALGALNVASMADGDELAWHFDQTDFVVSIALRSSEHGGHFECVNEARTRRRRALRRGQRHPRGRAPAPGHHDPDGAGHADVLRGPAQPPPGHADRRADATTRRAARVRHRSRARAAPSCCAWSATGGRPPAPIGG